MNGLLGVKLGMSQHFAADGKVVPVTVIRVGPCVVLQQKTKERDGYRAVLVGLEQTGRSTRRGRANIRRSSAGVAAYPLREFLPAEDEDFEVGARLGADLFSPEERVRVSGVSKGKGFAGVMRRHGFGGGPGSHGSKFHRAPGAIGMCATPSRVLPGTRLPGHMGDARVTVRNLRVVRVDSGQNLLLVRGAVPGPRGGYVEVRKS